MAKPKSPKSYDLDTLKLFWRATTRHKSIALLSLLSPLGAVFISVLVPFFASRILAKLVSHGTGANQYLLLMTISAAIGVILNRVGFTRQMVLMARTMSDLHERVFTRLLERSTSFHANQISGKLVSDALDFVAAFNALVSAAYVNGFPLFMIILVGLVIVFVNVWQLGIYVLFVVTVTLVWAYLDSRIRFEMRNNRLAATRNLTGHLSDTIVNAQTVKTFAREIDEERRNKKLNIILRDLRITDWQRAGRSGNSRMAALLAMQIGLLFLISKLDTGSTNILATGFFAFTYVFTITSRLFDINAMTRQIEEAFLQASPMTRMLSEDIEVKDIPNARALEVPKGSIVFDKVHFHYHDTSSDQTVFAGLDLTIAAGERVGLVGPSGGGKSTLTRLLLRFENIDTGTITVDGQDISEVTQVSLRRSIAYVPQEPLLFHRSIRENITYGRQNATEAEIIEAAHKAYASDFIAQLPNGLDTIVGERGIKLSGGQRQRVAIARAILKDAPILVLDEATSALDSESEVMIQKALWELMKDRTAIVVAHRLSTINKLDRIIVLDEGDITQQGTHTELLGAGLYGKLWQHQSGGFIK